MNRSWVWRLLQKIRMLVIGLTLLIPWSCIGDFDGTLPKHYEWKPLLAFPIGWAEFGLGVGQGFDTLLQEIDTSGFPQWVSLVKIPFSGNLLFDFEEVLGAREEVRTVQLRVNAYNGFPVDIFVQGYLYDENGNMLDSLFTPILTLQRGTLSGGGETFKYAETQHDILFEEERLDILLSTKEIVFIGEINNVAYFPEFTFEVQLGAVLGVVSDITF